MSRGVRLVAAGGFSSAAIDEVKQVYTWGDGRDGQLGHNDQIDVTCPMIVKKPQDENAVEKDHISTFRARSIYLGPNFMLAMGLDAELEKRADPKFADRLTKFAWGTNEKGQLGMPYLNDKKRKIGDRKLQPEKIPFLTKWSIKEIACGLEHVVAVVELRQVSYSVVCLALISNNGNCVFLFRSCVCGCENISDMSEMWRSSARRSKISSSETARSPWRKIFCSQTSCT